MYTDTVVFLFPHKQTHRCLHVHSDHAHNHDNSRGLSASHGNLGYHDHSTLFHSYLKLSCRQMWNFILISDTQAKTSVIFYL